MDSIIFFFWYYFLIVGEEIYMYIKNRCRHLFVFINGSKQIVALNYTETSSSSITFLTGLNVGDVVEFISFY